MSTLKLRSLILIFFLALPFVGSAQSGTNNLDFENWTTDILGAPTPSGFASVGASENTSNPFNGGSALKITTEYSSALGDTMGWSVTGDPNSFAFGEPYTKRPDSLTGYVKTMIPDPDTAVILFQLTKYNSTLDSTIVVGTAAGFLPDTVSSWTRASFAFNYDTCMVPDSILGVFAAESNSLLGIGSSTIGGVLEADDFELHAPAPVIDTVLITDAKCNTGGGDGEIEIVASNVDTCSIYSIDGGNSYQSSNVFSSLDSGYYDVMVSTANGTASKQVVVDSTTTHYIASVDTTKAQCGFADGEFTIHADGGTTPYQFSNDGGTTFQSDSTFSTLTSGTYNVVVQDANGCNFESQVFLGSYGADFFSSVNVSSEACGQNDGSITITASGGTSPYEYSIDGGATFQTSNTFNGLSSGSYSVVIRDAASCTDDSTITVGSVPGPNIDSVGTVDVTCGMSDGELTVYASGGTSPYTYSNDGGSTFQGGDNFSGLNAGNYNVVVEDANGCQASASASLDTLLVPDAVAMSDTDSVDLNTSGTVNFDASNSTGNDSYSWNFGDGDGGTGATVTHTYDSTGTFTVELVVTEGNCTDTATTTIVVVNSSSIADASNEGSTFSVFPNPHEGQFTIEMESVERGSIEIMDMTGRIVEDKNLNGTSKVSFNLEDEGEGLYMVRLKDENGATIQVEKMVISR